MEPPVGHGPLPETEGRWSSSRLVPLAIVAAAGAVIAVLLFSARGEQDAGLAALGAGTVQAESLPITLPIRYVAGQVVVDARLGDDETARPMLLDTGAPTAISDSLAGIHGGDPAGTVSTLTIDGQVTSSPVVPLRRLRIGPAEFRDVGAVETAIDRADPLWCLADAGLIGASLMRNAVWQPLNAWSA
ncbi:MAG TPA: retropepsin-like aspartic protease [Candidatus Deferrimicrobium sp.]|nr:retropepsin-like aspartic protease [Candidatus Deferrimicrobium sp.]